MPCNCVDVVEIAWYRIVIVSIAHEGSGVHGECASLFYMARFNVVVIYIL